MLRGPRARRTLVVTFDDGYGGPGEPDFNDLVIVIKATP